MKSLRKLALATALVGAALPATQANAVTFNLIDVGGAGVGTQARAGFEMAAAYWSSVLTNNSTVNLNIGFSALGAGILGSTGSARADVSLASLQAAMNATGNSALDAQALGVLNSKISGGSIGAITNTPASGALGVNTANVEWDNDGSENNSWIYGNTSVLKAMGLTEDEYYGGSFSNIVDGQVRFSTSFNWDFNPTDGITAGSFDFIGVAIHEIGHALGFVSGVDLYDAYGFPNGPSRAQGGFDFDNAGGGLMSTLDLFRYSNDPNGVAPGSDPALDWSVTNAARIAAGGNPYFSIDGGATQLFGDSRFSTGAYNGDGRQASHFKDSPSCVDQLGIMDPTFCNSTVGTVKALDLAAFDAMGWNLSLDILANSGYSYTTAQIYNQFSSMVPEPATWAMMIAGFGFVGATMRSSRRQTKVSFA